MQEIWRFFFIFIITDNAVLLRLVVQDYIKVMSAHIMTPTPVEFSLQVILKIATWVQWNVGHKDGSVSVARQEKHDPVPGSSCA